jgi:ABC-type sugar transport system ATPase subunit
MSTRSIEPAPRSSKCATCRKHLAAFKAVDGVTINLFPGEVVGVLGHNGAGKSVLMKMLSGALPRDGGEIYVNGERCEINNPRDARPLPDRDDLPDISRSPTISTPPRTCF